MMRRFGLAAAVMALALALAPAADAATTWSARFSGHGSATVRVGSPSRLVLGLTGFRAGTSWTVSLRSGSCASVGALILTTRVTATSTRRLSRTITLTTAQTRAAKLPLALRVGILCAPLTAPAPEPGTFGDGIWRVGTAVQPGTYRTPGGPSCYWARLSGFGSTDYVIENGAGAGPQVATIDPGDLGFQSIGCGTWKLNAPAAPTVSPGDGTWRVGIDIVPGIYEVTVPEAGACYWARLFGFSGNSIINNGIVTSGSAIVTVAPTDVGFRSSRCGNWRLAPH
jgi:hypothetical protein